MLPSCIGLRNLPVAPKPLRSASCRRKALTPQTAPDLRIVSHPLVQHKMSLMRGKDTPTGLFRQLLRETSLLLGYEVTRELPVDRIEIETPLESMQAPTLAGKPLCLISILRAGDGLLAGLLDLVPNAPVGHVGLYRDPKTLRAVEYYFKVPDQLDQRMAIVVDPMLATGNSAVAALRRLKQAGATQLRFLCLLAAPEGVQALSQAHPDVPIFTAALDRGLNEKAYILPGLGDAGDRLYGTM